MAKKMTQLAIKTRNKWVKEDPKLMAKFSKDKDAVRIINSLAMVVSDYKHRENT